MKSEIHIPNSDTIRVLLIEDNPGDSRLIREMIVDAGDSFVQLECVDRLGTGLERLAMGGFDALLLDLSLPDSQGLATFSTAYTRAPGIATIVLTGLDDEELAVKAVRAGAQDYLVKGQVDGNLLVRSLRYAIERKRVQKQIEIQMHRLSILRDINLATTSTLDLQTTLDVLVEQIDLLLPYAAVVVKLLNRQSAELEPAACRNVNLDDWRAGSHNIVKGMTECKAQEILTNIQANQKAWETDFFQKQGLVSFQAVPLIVKDEPLGVLSFFSREERQFTEDEVMFLTTLAGQAAVAIHNSKLYEQTRDQAVELEQANKVKTEFLSIMSHELRTPLGIIMNYTGMIQDKLIGEINQKQDRAVGKIMNQSKELLAMINSILEATRMEAGRIRVEKHAVNLGTFLNELRTDYDVPLDKDITFTWDYPLDLPVISIDGGKLRYVLQNLIGNAVKFTEKGKVTLSAQYFPETKTVEFKVMDTGVGIPKEAFSVIFEKFRQLDSSRTRSYGGMGLGLFIVKEIAESLGGKVSVDSEPGKGSTFTVSLPGGEPLH